MFEEIEKLLLPFVSNRWATVDPGTGARLVPLSPLSGRIDPAHSFSIFDSTTAARLLELFPVASTVVSPFVVAYLVVSSASPSLCLSLGASRFLLC